MKFKLNKKIIVLIIFFILAFLLRFYISNMGNNYDYGSWKIVGPIVTHGKNVYMETARYSYGPLWAYLLGFFKKISILFYNDLFIYRFLIIISLTLADILISIWLYNYAGGLAFFWFLFNPISIYVSGFHNQFDNIAIVFALYSFRLIERYRSNLKGYVLLGFSLITKHIFLFFPIWLFIGAKNTKQRLYSLIPLLIFFVSFLPFSTSQKAIVNIWDNVFVFHRDILYSFLPRSPLLTPIIILCLIFPFGFLLKKEKISTQGLLYLLIFIIALINIGGQYLAIPLVAFAAIDPLIGLAYSSFAMQNIIFHAMSLEMSLIISFQLSWLIFLKKYFLILRKPLKFISIILLIIAIFYSLPRFIIQGKNILFEERKNIWFMQSLYPADKFFFISKEKSKSPLTSGIEVKGQFTALQNNLGFITIPFSLENPQNDFLGKGYKVTVKIREIGNSMSKFQETRTLRSGLTGEGILLGFPLINDSNGKLYEVSIFTDVPKNINYLTLNLSGKVQVRYFLSRNLLLSFDNIIQFIYNKLFFLFLQETFISFLMQLYSYLWLIVIVVKLFKFEVIK